MRKGFLALAFGAATMVGIGVADAMPAVHIDGEDAAPKVVLVAGGCGIGFHRGTWGGCRPNGWVHPYGYGRPYYYRGYHRWHRW